MGNSQTEAGTVTGHLFDIETGELRGHATWHWVDESVSPEPNGSGPSPSDEDAEAAAVAILIAIGIVAAAIAATPPLQRWWKQKLRPAITSAWNRAIGSIPQKRASATDQVPLVADEQANALAVLTRIATVDAEFTMSSAEWITRFQAMLAADEFRNEQLRILARSHVIEADPAAGNIGQTRNLTAHEFTDRLRLALKTNPISLDDQTSTALVRTFGAPVEAIHAKLPLQLE